MTTRKITGKGMMVKTPRVHDPIEDGYDPRVDSFNSYCDLTPKLDVFEINSPVSLPVETKAGYRTRPFIGGESFIPKGAYVGRSGRVIYVFRPYIQSTEFETIEVSSDKLDTVFPEFQKWLRLIDSELDEWDRKATQKRASEVEEEAHNAAQTQALLAAKQKDDRYGSW